ncbi:AAA family ATPase [Microvirga guangxiensis]|uniref:Pilus assembly protein CpaE n=1 Tax=Microvirga guangxiensis TaxID=549386 RepID=A0A1G5IA57_9HYPH|nr:AAA family ATPase [Microvirga guangxiensis]SCY72827.1 pilus assembly protein CpaE [Microvirga guangxiensis]
MTDLTLDMADNLSRRIAEPDTNTVFYPETLSMHAREAVRIPRIVIEAFCDTSEVAAAIESSARDRLMARTRVTVRMGGVAAAIAHYQHAPTPSLVIIESHSAGDLYLADLDRLAEVCDPGTRVMAIGHTNDIGFYRDLMKRGLSEYLLAPITPVSLITSISGVYGESSSGKLGQTYAFIGAKGGVGSSTIAHNMAWMIARQQQSDVVIADLDLPFGTASLDFNLDTGPGLAEAIQDTSRLDEVLLDRLLTKCGDHLSLLSAPTDLEKSYDLGQRELEALIEVAQSSIPFTILDMPHMWTSWSRNMLTAADEIIITAVPDLANLRNAKNMIGVLKQARPHDPPPRLILNQVGMPKRPEIKPKDFAKAVQLEPIACIPFDAHAFGTAANKGQMVAEISSKGAAHKSFREIADLLTGRKDAKNTRRGSIDLATFFGKLKRNSLPGRK